MKNLRLLLALALCVSCQKSVEIVNINESKNDSIITLILKKRTYKTDTIYGLGELRLFKTDGLFYNIKDDFNRNYLPKNNIDKTDTIKIKTKKDIILFHPYYCTNYTLYQFKPGDVVEFDYPNDYPICKITNRKLSDINLNFITLYNLKNNNVENEHLFFMKNLRYRNQQEIKEAISDYIKANKHKEFKIDSLKSKSLLDDEVYQLIKKDLAYLDLNLNKSKYLNILEKNIDLSIKNGQNLVIDIFNHIYTPILIKNGNGKIIDSRIQLEKVIHETKISENNKDFLLYYFMENILINFSNSDKEEYLFKFSKAIKNKEHIKTLKNKYFSNVKTNLNETSLMDEKRNKFSLQQLIKNKFKDKIVFVDFWASWCQPCRKSIPHSLALQNMYKNKNIVIVYISIDRDFEKWKTASKSEKIDTSHNNFIALNYPEALFYKDIELKSIPRYLIFNKKGDLVHENAPSPDSKEIIIELNKYLNE